MTKSPKVLIVGIAGFFVSVVFFFVLSYEGGAAADTEIQAVYSANDIPYPPKECRSEEQAVIDELKYIAQSRILEKRQELLRFFPNSLLVHSVLVNAFSQSKDVSETQYNRIRALEKSCSNWAFPQALLGNYYFHKQEYDSANNAYQTALAIQPQYPTIQFNLALVASKQEQFTDVIEIVNQLLEQEPQHPNALLLRSQAHISLQNWLPAERDAVEAQKKSPRDTKPYLLLWTIYSQTKQENLANAVGCKLKELGDPMGKKLCTMPVEAQRK